MPLSVAQALHRLARVTQLKERELHGGPSSLRVMRINAVLLKLQHRLLELTQAAGSLRPLPVTTRSARAEGG